MLRTCSSRLCGRTALATVCVMSLLLAVGCGPRDLHRVSGRVEYQDGSPVSSGRVVIEYGDGTGAVGVIQPDGSFRIGTRRESDGMRAGNYRVAIKDAIVPEGPEGQRIRVLVHPRFADVATSGLEFTVPEQTTWQIVVDRP